VLLAHQLATLDQVSEGRLVLGVGIARDVPDIRAEFTAAGVPFDKRVGRLLEGLRLCRALWSGAPVDWDGRWHLERGVLAPTPHRPDGPPIWVAGSLDAALDRAGRLFDGWLPNDTDPARWAEKWGEVQRIARNAGRDPQGLAGAVYLTLSLDDHSATAERRLDAFLEGYYGQPATVIRRRQVCYAGAPEGAAEWLAAYAQAGVAHLVLRFAGDPERHLAAVAKVRESLGW
jgi:alkanesulfonate monooxygenase SsuD/methylene tetrahydromethanopterin reductase-like flavin-dependent oxidoreductase (luciferase family)